MSNDWPIPKPELFAKRIALRRQQENVSKNLKKWIIAAEESAKINQPYNHQVLYLIKKELDKIFEEELENIQ